MVRRNPRAQDPILRPTKREQVKPLPKGSPKLEKKKKKRFLPKGQPGPWCQVGETPTILKTKTKETRQNIKSEGPYKEVTWGTAEKELSQKQGGGKGFRWNSGQGHRRCD